MKIKPCPVCGSSDIIITSYSEMTPQGELNKISAGLKCEACNTNLQQSVDVPSGHQLHTLNEQAQKRVFNLVLSLWNKE
jgi:transcription elongation factor Elf1